MFFLAHFPAHSAGRKIFAIFFKPAEEGVGVVLTPATDIWGVVWTPPPHYLTPWGGPSHLKRQASICPWGGTGASLPWDAPRAHG